MEDSSLKNVYTRYEKNLGVQLILKLKPEETDEEQFLSMLNG